MANLLKFRAFRAVGESFKVRERNATYSLRIDRNNALLHFLFKKVEVFRLLIAELRVEADIIDIFAHPA
jgi:hypothetical protein